MVPKFVTLLLYGDPRSLVALKNIYRPHGVHYFANAEAWMTTEIMQEVLKMLSKKMIAEGRNVLLFLDNASSRPDILEEGLKNIKLDLFPKNTTSRLQPCDTGITKSFKHKYKKLLIATFSLVSTQLIELQLKLSKMSLSCKSSNRFKLHGLM